MKTVLTCAEHGMMGSVLNNILYSEKGVLSTLDFGTYYGCPHNGGEHTLTLMTNKEDTIAFLNLVKETHVTSTKYIDLVLNEISDGSENVSLKRLMRDNGMHPYV